MKSNEPRELKFRLIRNGNIVGYEYHYQGTFPYIGTFHVAGAGHYGLYHALNQRQHDVGPQNIGMFENVIADPDHYIHHDSKQQALCMHDRNGVEAYEGDVVNPYPTQGDLKLRDHLHIVHEGPGFKFEMLDGRPASHILIAASLAEMEITNHIQDNDHE